MDKVKTWNSEEGSEERKRKSRKRKNNPTYKIIAYSRY